MNSFFLAKLYKKKMSDTIISQYFEETEIESISFF